MKTCDNCMWKSYCKAKHNKPDENTCEDHSYKCDNCCDLADFEINEKKLCKECALEELNIITETITKYYIEKDEGCYDYLGNDEEDKTEDIIERVCKIKELEYKNLY